MTNVNADIDLRGLSRTANLPPPPRSRMRLLPVLLIVVFAGVLLVTLGDVFAPKVAVKVVRPEPVTEGVAAAASSGTALFQAAGWVEPDPFPILVPALVKGVVKDVSVLESQAVAAGDVVAVLVDDDARLELADAEATLAAAEAEETKDRAVLAVVEERFAAAVSVKERVATATAERAQRAAMADEKRRAVERLAIAAKTAVEELELARHLAEIGADGPRQVVLAEARSREAATMLAEAEAAARAADAERAKADAMLEAAESEARLRSEDRRMRDEARGELAAHEAASREARARRDRKALALERTRVRASSAGVVLARMAGPGTAIAEEGMPIVSLYDPTRLRVRVDVAQGDVGRARLGQRAEIMADVRPGKPYVGEITRIVHQADIAKVTLQVHVRIKDVDEVLRPEMLTQVRFYNPEGASSKTGAPALSDAVSIPSAAVVDGAVWTLDPSDGTVRRTPVTTTPGREGRVVVLKGIDLSSKVVVEAEGGLSRLEPGTRVTTGGR